MGSLLDQKNPLSEDFFPLFGSEHEFQRFDKGIIIIIADVRIHDSINPIDNITIPSTFRLDN